MCRSLTPLYSTPQACQLATRLRLHDRFGMDEFVTPLVLTDRANVAELFLAESPAHQTAAVTALDDLLERSLLVAARYGSRRLLTGYYC